MRPARARVTELLQRGEDRVERGRSIAHDRDRAGEVAADLGVVDVDVDDGLVGPRARGREVGADREDDVRAGDERRDALVDPRGPDRQRVPVVDRALALPGREDRRLEELGEGGRARRTRRRARRRRRPRPRGVRRRRAGRGRDGDGVGIRGLADVGRGVEQRDGRPTRRTPPAASRSRRVAAVRAAARAIASCTAPGISRGLERALLPRGDRADEVELVVDLVEEAETAADAVRGSPALRSAGRVTTPPTPSPGPSPRCTRRRRGRRTPRPGRPVARA